MTTAGTAKYATFQELLGSANVSEMGMLRVIGRIEQYDVRNSLVLLQEPSNKLLQIAIDATNIEPFSPKVGMLQQFIGEADYRGIPTNGSSGQGHEWVVVKALVHRCVDGLNIDVYTRANQLRQKNIDAQDQD